MTPGPLETFDALRLLARTGLRRKLNRWRVRQGSMKWFGRKKPPPVPGRRGTPSRRPKLRWLTWIFLPLMLLWVMQMAGNLLAGMGEHFRRHEYADDPRIAVSPDAFSQIAMVHREWKRVESMDPPATTPTTAPTTAPTTTPATTPATTSSPWSRRWSGGTHWKESSRQGQLRMLATVFENEARRNPDTAGDPDGHARRWIKVFKAKGPAGFRADPRRGAYVPWPSVRSWPRTPGAAGQMGSAVAGVLVFCSLMLLTMSLGSGNQDLGQVHWHMQWLFTFPVRARAIFLSQVLESSLLSPVAWIVVMPVLLAILWSAGYAWWALLLAPAVTVPVVLLLGAGKMLAETFLRRRLSRKRLKNCQAFFTAGAMACLMSILFVINIRPLPEAVCRLFDLAPSWLAWTPLGAPALLCRRGFPVPWALSVTGLWAAVLVWGAIRGAEWLVRDGLMGSAGAYQGARGRAAAAPPRGGIFKGILGKEVRLLLRDRNFFVQTLITPLMVIGFQVLIHASNMRRMRSVRFGPDAAAGIAFGVGAYVLMFSAFHALASEGASLWLLYTFPRRIESLLARKVRLWGTVAMVYAAAVLVPAWIVHPPEGVTDVLSGLTALAGVYIHAYLAAGIGAIGANISEPNPQRRVRPVWSFAYMFLAMLYAGAVYCPFWPVKPPVIALWCLLTWSLWRRMSRRLRYLLDTTESRGG